MMMALSGIVSPQIVRGLLNGLTDEVSILVYGGIILSGLVGSLLLFPHDTHEDVTTAAEGVDEVDVAHPRFNREQHSLRLEKQLSGHGPHGNLQNGRVSKARDSLDEGTQTLLAKQNNLNAQEAKDDKSSWKHNSLVRMFTLIKWSLLKSPYFLVTVLGSSYSFNALLSFFLYLPLHAESIGCSTSQKVLLTWVC